MEYTLQGTCKCKSVVTPVYKEYLKANDLHVGGIEKVKTIYLNAIVMLASALAMKKAKHAK